QQLQSVHQPHPRQDRLPHRRRQTMAAPQDGGNGVLLRMKDSAGTLLYRHTPSGLEVLLVHPSGSYNRGKPWGIPKGLPDEGEDLETAARRETWEEAGVAVTGILVSLGSIVYQSSKKRVHCFAASSPDDANPH